jgi:hypothetical protein
MRKQHKKQIELVRSLLDKPKWYNETITHPNWKRIKLNINLNQSIAVIDMPPRLREHYEEIDALKYWRQNYLAFTLDPAPRIIGVIA